MLRRVLTVVLVVFVLAGPAYPQTRPAAGAKPAAQAAAQTYFPERLDWQHKKPEDVGMDSALINEGIKIAVDGQATSPKDSSLFQYQSFSREPFNSIIGPVRDRGGASGIIVKNGYIVAEWGDPNRVDITHSVTKTFLTTVVGLAVRDGLIKDVSDYVKDYMPPMVDLFASEHNSKIEWDHLLRQTSDWEGVLWDKPDWADRPVGETIEQMKKRPMYEPGTHFKYNDVRVNVMALAALQVWRKPLPDVLREEVMGPIGASSTWRWFGYDNSWVEIDGKKVQSVSGGGHWGGGMFINSYDMARFGYLFLRNGKWKDKQIISPSWIEMARKPGPDNATYGYANWYLNPDRKSLAAAPATAVRFVGNGSNIVYIDWENDLVVIYRWIGGGPTLNNSLEKIIASIKTPAKAPTSSAANR